MNIPSCRECGSTDADPCIEDDGFSLLLGRRQTSARLAPMGNKRTGSVALLEETRDHIGKEDF